MGQTEPAGQPEQGAPISSATVDGEPEDAPARYEGWCPGYTRFTPDFYRIVLGKNANLSTLLYFFVGHE
ncbi:MAG: hypothetical protein LBQ51_04295 [Desulfovibrio sp.]|nr:hypothetical protein [Desulfovibrio sp.]